VLGEPRRVLQKFAVYGFHDRLLQGLGPVRAHALTTPLASAITGAGTSCRAVVVEILAVALVGAHLPAAVEIFEEIQSLADNEFDSIKFQKTPFDQEASVAAIFYEAIGAGLIDGITPLISGYKEKYDLYAKWGRRKVVLEFKARLGNLTKDFNDAQKYFDEIDAVVCWEVTDSDRSSLVTDSDRSSLGRMGIEVEEIIPSAFADESDQNLPNATHIMSLGGTRPVFVIDLKRHLVKR
jgi:molecular chaperone HtpG